MLYNNSRNLSETPSHIPYLYRHVETDTRLYTLGFIPLGIWGKVSGQSLVYLRLCTFASLSSCIPSISLFLFLLQASPLSLFFLILPVFPLSVFPLRSSWLPYLLSPTHFSCFFPPCYSRLLHISSPPSSFCVYYTPSSIASFFSKLLSSSMPLSFFSTSNSCSLFYSLLSVLCDSKLCTNSMYISLFFPTR